MTSSQKPVAVDGLTHASTVNAVVTCNDGASGTVTSAVLPLNDSAPPYLPAAVHVAPVMLPVFPVPEASVALLPAPSSTAWPAPGRGPLVPVMFAVVVAVVVVNA